MEKNKKLEQQIINLKMELATIIMGYENELLKCKREEISEFSKGCLERYYDIVRDLKQAKEKDGSQV
jgi:hypothetical protein